MSSSTPSSRPRSRSRAGSAAQLLTDVALVVLDVQARARMFHWSTTSYARHVATDELASDLVRHGDRLVEAMSGLLAVRVVADAVGCPAFLPTTRTSKGAFDLTAHIDFFVVAFPSRIDGLVRRRSRASTARESDTRTHTARLAPILSIRDDLVLAMAKAMYLFTMNV
jgi:hypothetical protein